MRFLGALGLLAILAAGLPVEAQINISAQTSRTDFLLYERMDLLVTISNSSESDVVLNNEEGRPWLSFAVSKKNHLPVHPERQGVFKPVSLKVGETKTLRVNLTPLFSFREEGNYEAQAVVDLPGAGEIASEAVPFSVLRGRQVWTERRSVEGAERVYSLIRFSPTTTTTELYLRVEDPGDNIVYTNIGLGQIEAYVDPQVYFDPEGSIHVLQLISMSTYLYTRADTRGKILHQGIFKTYEQIPPHLQKMEDGKVAVAGGIEQRPDMMRETLSAGQEHLAGTPRRRPNGDAPASGSSTMSAPVTEEPPVAEPSPGGSGPAASTAPQLSSPGEVSQPPAAGGAR